jgi:hypothetical protein
VRLPRQIEVDPCHDAVRAALLAHPRPLWAGGEVAVPLLAPTAALVAALRAARGAGHLRRGLEAVEAALAAERKGLAVAERRAGARQGERVSRLLLCARDGAERFYRHVERVLTSHAPRVLGCVVDLDGAPFGEMLYGPGASVKLVMVEHKDAVAAVLRAFVAAAAGVTPPGCTRASRSGAR